MAEEETPKENFGNGVRACLPIVLGYVAVGLVVGVVTKTAGLTVLEVTLMSLILYAGSAQLIVANLTGMGASASAIIFTIFLVNMRHFLYSASLAPHVRKLPFWQNILIGLELTDETFAVAANHLAGSLVIRSQSDGARHMDCIHDHWCNRRTCHLQHSCSRSRFCAYGDVCSTLCSPDYQ